jgi:chemotaxis signal transduction protein
MTAATHLGALGDERTVLEDRARVLARRVEEAGTTGAEHIVVRVGPQRLAIPADRTRHVADPRPITATPATSGAIVGVAAVLGQVVAAVDLAALLRVTAAVPPRQRHVVLLDEDLDSLALLVDGVERLEVVAGAAAAPDDALGELTSDAGEGLRLLHLDALLAALDPSNPRPSDSTGGTP